ncbi:MFS general substrate transporter [Meira miltonrushii]|uniref:MFS general substrate transporter n=1 Tax=Meira miltonrushii TaxID=1280837 RepID=A0A316VHX3_9BASI|nr:MFS general substrate transporter [Meira miltonrushii]PWN37257.1 MFS general substrate transporter [Meira miltonrushii]
MSESKNEVVVDNTVIAIDGSMAAIVPASQNGVIAGEPSSTPQDRTAVHSRAASIKDDDRQHPPMPPNLDVIKHLGEDGRVLHHSRSGGTLINDVHHKDNYNEKDPETPSVDREGSITTVDETQGPEYLSPVKFIPIFFGLCLVVFMISLDNTVVATAQVPIVNDIGGQANIAWLPTTFLIGQASFSILFGQILAFFSSKYVFMVALFLFELGSLVSGVAPNMGAVLAGRTVSGVGAAGIFMTSMQILAETTTVTARAQYMGILGALFAISMVAGPLIGGALSDHVTWRWVFYINLPIGGAAWLAVAFLFKSRPPLGSNKAQPIKVMERLQKMDIIGTVLFTGLVCMLVIPIQQAHQNGWKSITTWAPIAFASVVAILSGLWFKYLGEQRALVPLRLFKDANFVGCAILSFFTFWNSITFTYLIPLFFQTVRGRSATLAGVDMLAFMITLAIVSLFTGILAKNTGHYYPQTVFGPLFGVAGAALLYFQKVDSPLGFQIGTQILLGLGIGTVIQQPILTVQANITDRRLLAKATAFIVFSQRLGGGIGSSVSGAILSAQFPHLVRTMLPAGTDLSRYARITPEQVYQLPHGPERDAILQALTKTMTYIFIGGVPVFALIWIANLILVRIKNIKTQKVTRKIDILRFILRLPVKQTDSSKA